MKNLNAVPIATLWCAVLCSCAGLPQAAPPPADAAEETGRGGRSLTSILRPDARAEKPGTHRLALPKPGLSRREALLSLRGHALRFQAGLKDRLRASALTRANRSKGDKTVAAKKNPPPVRNLDTSPPVASTRSGVADPPARTVAGSDSGEAAQRGSSANGGTRTIYARLGDDVEISLAENGWLLLEMPPEGAGLSFVSRHIEEGKTFFKFRGRKIGQYVLPFQRQDQARGAVHRQTIEIKVVSQKEFDAALGRRESDADTEDKSRRRAAAAKLLELGDYDDALREYLASYAEGDPALNQLVAALALRQKDYANAILFWRKNLDGKPDMRDQAVLGLVRACIATNDRQALAGLVRPLFAVQSRPIEEELGLLIGFFAAVRDERMEFDLLQEYLKRFPAGARLDQVLFLLGQLHEFSRPFLDFKKSRECYAAIVKRFPESLYYAHARTRIDFLDRHYFLVQ